MPAGVMTRAYKAPKVVTGTFVKKPLRTNKTARNTKGINKLYKMLERKYFDVTQGTPLVVDWVGTNTNLLMNTPSQGDGGTSRDGDQIYCDSFDLNVEVSIGNADCTFRIICYWDDEMVVSSVANVLRTTGAILTPISQYNFEYQSLYKVLYNKTIILDALDNPYVHIRKRIKLDKKTIFQGGGSTTIRKGGLRVVMVSNKTTGATAPLAIWDCRLNYTE